MSGPNECQQRGIENLAAALNECLDAAVEKSTQAAAEKSAHVAEQTRREVNARLDRQDQVLRRNGETLCRQNDPLRMIRTRCGERRTSACPSTTEAPRRVEAAARTARE